MKLPTPSLSLEDQFAEFDVWITPSLGEIRDSERFQSELGRIVAVFEILRIATSDFADEKTCSAEAISKTFVSELSKTDASEQAEMLRALASVLYLVTGKSDNNSKCQFPIYLRDVACWTQFPSVRTVNGKAIVTKVSTPRELKADRIMSVVQSLSCDANAISLLDDTYCLIQPHVLERHSQRQVSRPDRFWFPDLVRSMESNSTKWQSKRQNLRRCYKSIGAQPRF